jgi:predicted kinase
MEKPELILLVGLQGSGKSTFAQQLLDENPNMVLLSSDALRKINPDWNNEAVFKKLYEDMNTNLKEGKSVIVDATNTSMKMRKTLLTNVRVSRDKYILKAIVVATPYHECLRRVSLRNEDMDSHFVPEIVLEKYLMSFEMPTYTEGDYVVGKGYDEIIVLPKKKPFNKARFDSLKGAMDKFDQQTKWHNRTLGKHSDEVWEQLQKTNDSDFYKKFALLHDYGKLHTQKFKDDGNAQYIKHANVGAYRLLHECSDLIEIEDYDEFIKLIAYINYHMNVFDWVTDKSKDKWKKALGENMYNDLVRFNECDKFRSE